MDCELDLKRTKIKEIKAKRGEVSSSFIDEIFLMLKVLKEGLDHWLRLSKF